MPKRINYYKCCVCGCSYKTFEEAEECEKLHLHIEELYISEIRPSDNHELPAKIIIREIREDNKKAVYVLVQTLDD
jgi:hypothetical protein